MMETAMNQDLDVPQVIDDTTVADSAQPFFEDFGAPPEDAPPAGFTGLEAVHDVPVKVQAVLGRSRMPIGELLRLKTGTVVELDRRVGEPVDIFVNNRLIARGEVVMIDNSLGVTLTEIVRPER